MSRVYTPLLSLFCCLTFLSINAQSQAQYTITFNSTWNETDHGTLPPTAHWSDLVGATHNSDVKFWELGQLASPGIEDVAEMGSNANFNSEVNTAIGNSDADQWLQAGFSPFAAISSATLSNVIVSANYPLLSLAAMVAPSPDWFVGIDSFSLLDMSNNWKTSVVLDMFVYDAGTEEGNAYSLSNPDTVPAVPVFSRINITPFNDQKIGTLTITLDQVLSNGNSEITDSIIIAPNPASSLIRIHNRAGTVLESIELYNLVGERVKRIQYDEGPDLVEIVRGRLASGIYIMKVTSSDNLILIRKLILD